MFNSKRWGMLISRQMIDRMIDSYAGYEPTTGHINYGKLVPRQAKTLPGNLITTAFIRTRSH
jgi:hypothetical protein